MTIVAPNTPRSAWIKDSGVVIEPSLALLVDEDGAFLVDENGSFLLDSVSTDGNVNSASWNAEDNIESLWANALESIATLSTRTTQQGDTRVTQQGDTRVSYHASGNIHAPAASWNEDSEEAAIWIDTRENIATVSTRVTASGDTRVTVQGDTRVSRFLNNNIQQIAWTADEYE